ncbi:MAG: hypothetical protein C4519_10360 [Desulfobacteraceae bacterium]|nr:MAG: hypothetical protein C4519_10360 [Desulfobacteraceae bacterium]
MKKIMISLLAIGFGAFIVTAVSADHHAVKLSMKEGMGSYLTDAKGMTLYWFTKDTQGMSNCNEGCLDKWPIYYNETIAATGGLNSSDFSTITRADGKKQTAFRGWPLYYFVMDKAAGDTTGQGVREVWYVIDPANFPPK